jgi:hypothetical protein
MKHIWFLLAVAAITIYTSISIHYRISAEADRAARQSEYTRQILTVKKQAELEGFVPSERARLDEERGGR